MSDQDFEVVCSRIDGEKDFFNSVSQDIWKTPELGFQEEQAHNTLTSALTGFDFKVQKHYLLSTAFKAEYSTRTGEGPVIAILLEYDALPEIGHACGHNLIAEAGLAAAVAVKNAMDADQTLVGKLVVLGTPAEEGGGGKIKLLNGGAFDGVDAAMMVHPTTHTMFSPPVLSVIRLSADFKGKAAHASAFPWEGRNALDALVTAYQNIGLLRQHIQPSDRIHAIITKGGSAPNVIPDECRLEMIVRAKTKSEVMELLSRVKKCINSGATVADCSVFIHCNLEDSYENLMTNSILATEFEKYAKKLGMFETDAAASDLPAGSTDMGNVSHAMPSIHPFFDIHTQAINHNKAFTEASGSPTAQEPTLTAAKAMAMTVLKLMRCPKTLLEAKKQFERDIADGL